MMGIKEVYNLTRQIPLDLGLKNNPLWLHVLLSRPTGVVVLPSRATVAVALPFWSWVAALSKRSLLGVQ